MTTGQAVDQERFGPARWQGVFKKVSPPLSRYVYIQHLVVSDHAKRE